MGRALVGIGDGEAVVLTDIPTVRLTTKTVKLRERQLTLYGIGHLAMAMRRSTATIRRWQRKGIILPPIFVTADKVRWYTKEEVETYRRLQLKHNLTTGLDIENTGFPMEAAAEIQNLRKKIGG